MNAAARLVHLVPLALLCSQVCAANPALADEEERRISASLQSSLSHIDALGTRFSVLTAGGGVALSVGLLDWLELGGGADYGYRKDAAIPNARLGNERSSAESGFVAIASVHAAELTVHARFFLEGGPLLRARPFLGIRGGLGLRVLSSLTHPSPDSHVAVATSSDWGLYPVVGAELGTSIRLSDAISLAIATRGAASSRHRSAGISFDLSWLTYDLI